MRVLRILAGRRLPCGCLVGIYETYDGPIAQVVDERNRSCPDPTHRPGHILRDPLPDHHVPVDRSTVL
jgi:hypothetical protein